MNVAGQGKTCLGRCSGRSHWLGVDRVRTPVNGALLVGFTNMELEFPENDVCNRTNLNLFSWDDL